MKECNLLRKVFRNYRSCALCSSRQRGKSKTNLAIRCYLRFKNNFWFWDKMVFLLFTPFDDKINRKISHKTSVNENLQSVASDNLDVLRAFSGITLFYSNVLLIKFANAFTKRLCANKAEQLNSCNRLCEEQLQRSSNPLLEIWVHSMRSFRASNRFLTKLSEA